MAITEILQNYPEFEQIYIEKEKTYLPIFPEELDHLRETAITIEQPYLSHPSEDYSLRLREVTLPDGTKEYSAGLKSRAEITDNGRERLEVETLIDAKLYDYYAQAGLPTVRKLRTDFEQDIVIDFYHDGVAIEAESSKSWSDFTDQFGDRFVDITGDRIADNEWRAHLEYRRENDGQEALVPLPELEAESIALDIMRRYTSGERRIIIQIGGRSGSGKSTIVRELVAKLAEYGLSSDTTSTDDYHRGKTWLDNHKGGEWTEWDHPLVYNTSALAEDLKRFSTGEVIPKLNIDFSVCEPQVTGAIGNVDVLIVEGIYAGCEDIKDLAHLYYEMTTPLATCIGRRLLRDLRERPQFANPVVSLKYMLEQAEPAYRAQTK
ncbi:MAG: hypothetical protein WBB94_02450 [Candidatus Saccharimonadaceae bacterium]